MARRSAAFKRPPVPVPSASPAGVSTRNRRPAAVDLASPVNADVAVETVRRRGRGAQSNASGRYEPVARVAFDDGWQNLEDLPPFKTTVHGRRHPQDHHPQRVARHPLRPLDQSLSRLRARLHLLLRAADPRLSRAVAGARFRVQAVRQARRPRSCWSANCRRRATRRAPSRSAPTPIPTSRSRREYQVMRRILEVLERFGHPVGIVTKSALVTRDIDILSRMAKPPARQGRAVGDHARSASSRARWSRAPRRRRAGWTRCGN